MAKKKVLWIIYGLLIASVTAMLFLSVPQVKEEKQYLIGVINYSSAAEPAFAGFKKGMQELGYLQGKNVRYLYKGYIKDKKALAVEGERLMAQGVDLIFSMSTPATMVAKKVTAQSGVPVVFAPVSNPVASGIVKDLKHPGGNITGVTFRFQEPKRLEFLTRIVPHAKRICFPYNPNDKSPSLNLKRLRKLAPKLGLELVTHKLANYEEIALFLENFPRDVDAVFIPTDGLMASRTHDFVQAAIRLKLPLTTPQREGVRDGALFSYGFSLESAGEHAAHLADQIIRGVPPADLPVEVAEFITTINIATAQKIGLEIPGGLLRQATVIRE